MAIHINDALPLLNTILRQQRLISDRLRTLIELFKREPEPIEPTLRLMLKPLSDGLETMQETLAQPSRQGSSENESVS